MAANTLGAPCKACGSPTTRVIQVVRATDGRIVRRRHCRVCDHRYYTVQSLEDVISDYRLTWLKVDRKNTSTRPVKIEEAV